MKSLIEPIAEAREQIADAELLIRQKKEFLAACQKVCTHEWVDAPDRYDAHKGEEFSRCTICGKVV